MVNKSAVFDRDIRDEVDVRVGNRPEPSTMRTLATAVGLNLAAFCLLYAAAKVASALNRTSTLLSKFPHPHWGGGYSLVALERFLPHDAWNTAVAVASVAVAALLVAAFESHERYLRRKAVIQHAVHRQHRRLHPRCRCGPRPDVGLAFFARPVSTALNAKRPAAAGAHARDATPPPPRGELSMALGSGGGRLAVLVLVASLTIPASLAAFSVRMATVALPSALPDTRAIYLPRLDDHGPRPDLLPQVPPPDLAGAAYTAARRRATDALRPLRGPVDEWPCGGRDSFPADSATAPPPPVHAGAVRYAGASTRGVGVAIAGLRAQDPFNALLPGWAPVTLHGTATGTRVNVTCRRRTTPLAWGWTQGAPCGEAPAAEPFAFRTWLEASGICPDNYDGDAVAPPGAAPMQIFSFPSVRRNSLLSPTRAFGQPVETEYERGLLLECEYSAEDVAQDVHVDVPAEGDTPLVEFLGPPRPLGAVPPHALFPAARAVARLLGGRYAEGGVVLAGLADAGLLRHHAQERPDAVAPPLDVPALLARVLADSAEAYFSVHRQRGERWYCIGPGYTMLRALRLGGHGGEVASVYAIAALVLVPAVALLRMLCAVYVGLPREDLCVEADEDDERLDGKYYYDEGHGLVRPVVAPKRDEKPPPYDVGSDEAQRRSCSVEEKQ